MLFLTQLKLASLDKKIISCLKKSMWYSQNRDNDIYKMSLRDIDRNEEWVIKIEMFINTALNEKRYEKLLNESPLDKEELVNTFLLMTIATLPNPLFKTGKSRFGYTLVRSAMYQEIDKQLKPFLESLLMGQGAEWEKEQFGFRFATEVITFARFLKRAHTQAYGEIFLEETL